jgi:hypothetical protein
MSTDENEFKKVEWRADQWHVSDDDDANGQLLRPRGPGISAGDLELLKLAARALGAVRVEEVDGENWLHLYFSDGSTIWSWNSLLHSDDALNLLADLSIDVLQSSTTLEALAVAPMQRVMNEPWGEDKRAATRRAVTRAAAEIAVAQAKEQA